MHYDEILAFMPYNACPHEFGHALNGCNGFCIRHILVGAHTPTMVRLRRFTLLVSDELCLRATEVNRDRLFT